MKSEKLIVGFALSANPSFNYYSNLIINSERGKYDNQKS